MIADLQYSISRKHEIFHTISEYNGSCIMWGEHFTKRNANKLLYQGKYMYKYINTVISSLSLFNMHYDKKKKLKKNLEWVAISHNANYDYNDNKGIQTQFLFKLKEKSYSDKIPRYYYIQFTETPSFKRPSHDDRLFSPHHNFYPYKLHDYSHDLMDADQMFHRLTVGFRYKITEDIIQAWSEIEPTLVMALKL